MDNQELRKQAQALKPAVIIGKNGITQTTIEQITLYLKAHKLGKIKLGSNFLDAQDNKTKDEHIQEVVEKTKAELIHKVGNVFVLYKR